MRHTSFILALLLAAACWSGSGCLWRKSSSRTAKPAAKLVVPAAKYGRVVKVNAALRFVVLNFPVGSQPEQGTNLSLFRGNLKVADVRITGPQLDDNIVADILAGEAQPGDEARVP